MIQTDEQILENQQKHGPKRGGTTHSFLMSDVLAGWKGSRGGFLGLENGLVGWKIVGGSGLFVV